MLEKYNSHRYSRTKPDSAELCSCLNEIITQFSRVYIVVDALDECDEASKTRRSLLSLLQNLGARVQLLFTSRPLQEVLPSAVQLEITAQKDDLHNYLTAQIEQESVLAELCVKDEHLRREVIDEITTKASGMLVYNPSFTFPSFLPLESI